jgi:hypothetical protein
MLREEFLGLYRKNFCYSRYLAIENIAEYMNVLAGRKLYAAAIDLVKFNPAISPYHKMTSNRLPSPSSESHTIRTISYIATLK